MCWYLILLSIDNYVIIIFPLAIRLYFLVIPLFAWIFSVWGLVVVGPLYMWLAVRMEDVGWLKGELEQHLTRIDGAKVGDANFPL